MSDPGVGALILRLSHQMPHQMRLHLAEQMGLPVNRIRVICADVGGGFGVTMHVYQDEMAVAAASRLLQRPVRWIADRMESMMADIHAREHVVTARMAVDADGHILGFDMHDVQGLGAVSVYPRSSTVEAISLLRSIGAPYRFGHGSAKIDSALQNKVATGQCRAVGAPVGCAVPEHLVDKGAAARREDPCTLAQGVVQPPRGAPRQGGTGLRLLLPRSSSVAASSHPRGAARAG